MTDAKGREQFIPIHRAELVELLAAQTRTPPEREQFLAFCKVLTAHLHYAYQQRLEQLKLDYRPFDPDQDIPALTPLPEEARAAAMDRLFADFTALLERANYQRLTIEQIRSATHSTSFWGLNLDVDFTAFERLEVFYRGAGLGLKKKLHWWDFLELFPEVLVKVPTYQRLVGIVKLRPHHRLGPEANTRDVLLKMFKEIPQADVEILLPGARTRMTRLDKGMVGYPLAAGVAMTMYNIGASFFAAGLAGLASLASWTVALALGGYGYKSYYSFSVKRQAYTLRLTKSLYYQALASNGGVLYKLLDEGEEQDGREAMLAYFYLWRYAGPEGWTVTALDQAVESDLQGRVGVSVSFETSEALARLASYQLVERAGERYVAVPLADARRRLDERWDSFFPANPV